MLDVAWMRLAHPRIGLGHSAVIQHISMAAGRKTVVAERQKSASAPLAIQMVTLLQRFLEVSTERRSRLSP